MGKTRVYLLSLPPLLRAYRILQPGSRPCPLFTAQGGSRGLGGRAGIWECFPGTREGLGETSVGFHVLSFLEPQDRGEGKQLLPLSSAAISCFVPAGLQLLVFTNTKRNDRTTLSS